MDGPRKYQSQSNIILHAESIKYKLISIKRLIGIENKLLVTKRERYGGESQIRGMGLTDTNYYT